MPAKETTDADLVLELGTLLSGTPSQPDGANRRSEVGEQSVPSFVVTMESLNTLTQKQLKDASKRMGLTAVSKLKKDELAQAVLNGWQALVSERAGVSTTPVDGNSRSGTNGDATADRFALSHKFEVGPQTGGGSTRSADLARSTAKEIPWGYGHDRVTAMPVDPDRLFAYWEVLDESIARARAQLGRGGPGAWLNMRVYDTTGRIFDGTNAHENFDHRVDRGDRQWFFLIGKPTSQLIVEIGMKSDEGYFVKIARSGRVEFPRREPVGQAATEPEWLTVRMAAGQIERTGHRAVGGHARSAGAPVGGPGRQLDQIPVPATAGRHVPWQDALRLWGTGRRAPPMGRSSRGRRRDCPSPIPLGRASSHHLVGGGSLSLSGGDA